jgi:hypothetical protein
MAEVNKLSFPYLVDRSQLSTFVSSMPRHSSDSPSSSEPDRDDYEDVDVDAPRIAQWEPDEFENGSSDRGESEDDGEMAPNRAGPSHVQLVHLSVDVVEEFSLHICLIDVAPIPFVPVPCRTK